MYFNMITISTIAWICVPILYLSVAAEFHSSSWGWGCEGTNSSVLYIYQTPSAFGATQIWNRDRLSCSTIMKSEITFIKAVSMWSFCIPLRHSFSNIFRGKIFTKYPRNIEHSVISKVHEGIPEVLYTSTRDLGCYAKVNAISTPLCFRWLRNKAGLSRCYIRS